MTFLSTLSLRRATKICKYVARRNVISIHALLAESDGPWSTLPIGMANFYPRSPCGERLVVDGHRVHITRFLSTLSLRRATSLVLLERLVIWYFYPRSPCGERPPPAPQGESSITVFYPRSPCGERLSPSKVISPIGSFSIHALLAESDVAALYIIQCCIDFSIHALLAESDRSLRLKPSYRHIFYPRSPCGERPGAAGAAGAALFFLSTLSLRRATPQHLLAPKAASIFYPRSPCGERRSAKKSASSC